tara:strand:- start:8187 stop:10121 length:1935 start_codon:yes stop_codon:yes gene_type:complete
MAANIKTIINEDPSTEILGVSRDDLKAGDIVHCFSADSALDTGYSWTMVHSPEGSTAELTVLDNQCSFTVDVEGPYLVRLVVDPDTEFEDSQYLRLRSLTRFGSLRLVAAGEQMGDFAIPSDLTGAGWAKDQNFNISSLGTELSAVCSSGRILYVDANRGFDDEQDQNVEVSGYGNFHKIQDAIDCAVDHITSPASETNVWTILVRTGVYVENLSMRSGVLMVAEGDVIVKAAADNQPHSFNGGEVRGVRFHSRSEEPEMGFIRLTGGEAVFQDCEISRLCNVSNQGSCVEVIANSRGHFKNCEIINEGNATDKPKAIELSDGSSLVLTDCHVQGGGGVNSQHGDCDVEITRSIIEATFANGYAVKSSGTLDISYSELVTDNEHALIVTPSEDFPDGGGQTHIRYTKIDPSYKYDSDMDVYDLKMVGVELEASTDFHSDVSVLGSIMIGTLEEQPDEDANDPILWANEDKRLLVDSQALAYDEDVAAVLGDLEEVAEEVTTVTTDVNALNALVNTLKVQITELQTKVAELESDGLASDKLTHLHRTVVEDLEFDCHDCDVYLAVQTVANGQHIINLEDSASSGRRLYICDETGLGEVIIRPTSTTASPSTINGLAGDMVIKNQTSVHLICSGLKDDGSVNWALN